MGDALQVYSMEFILTCGNYSAFKMFTQSTYSYRNQIREDYERGGRMLCTTDLTLIRRHTYKCNTFSYVDFETFSKSANVLLWYSQFQLKRVSKEVSFL